MAVKLCGLKLALLVCGFYYIMLVSNGLSAVTSLTAASSASCQLTLNISLPHSPPRLPFHHPLILRSCNPAARRQLLHIANVLMSSVVRSALAAAPRQQVAPATSVAVASLAVAAASVVVVSLSLAASFSLRCQCVAKTNH